MKAPLITTSGTKGTVELPVELFANKPNQQLLAQAVRVYRSNLRQGSGVAKTRSEINLTTKKWYRQKGTGGARHGAKSAHIFVGGGVAHGPTKDQNWRLSLSKSLRKKSLQLALLAQAENIFVCWDLTGLQGKTKQAAELLSPVLDRKRVLVITHEMTAEAKRSLNNLPQVAMISADQLNALHVLEAQVLVFTKESLSALTARFSDQPKVRVLEEEKVKSAPAKNETKSAKPAKTEAKTKAPATKPAKKTPAKKATKSTKS